MDIFEIFYQNTNKENAEPMSLYMRSLFPFLGLKKPERVALSKDFLRSRKDDTEVDWEFISKCYEKEEREFQYLAIDYLEKVRDLLIPSDIIKIEELITTKSWWDTVDAINRLVGYLAKKYPQLKEDNITEWVDSDNIWLNRISIIFQLKFKEETDTEFLIRAILTNSYKGEFFIDKAIGWALREYSKTNREWVKDFIENNPLSKLSVREGSKYL
jgi:3-methyladenine DNA glycosylase AlkD